MAHPFVRVVFAYVFVCLSTCLSACLQGCVEASKAGARSFCMDLGHHRVDIQFFAPFHYCSHGVIFDSNGTAHLSFSLPDTDTGTHKKDPSLTPPSLLAHGSVSHLLFLLLSLFIDNTLLPHTCQPRTLLITTFSSKESLFLLIPSTHTQFIHKKKVT
jgi:hypothetical protein